MLPRTSLENLILIGKIMPFQGIIKAKILIVARGGISMADVKKSKTNVAARQEAKSAAQLCKFCGNKIDVVMTMTPNGKKMMIRRCCGMSA